MNKYLFMLTSVYQTQHELLITFCRINIASVSAQPSNKRIEIEHRLNN